MQRAPSVSYPVGRSVWERRGLAVLAALLTAAGLAGLWSAGMRWSAGEVGGTFALGAALGWVVLAGLACWGLARRERAVLEGELAWTAGEHGPCWEWRLGTTPQVVVPQLRLDLGAAIWLRLQTGDGTVHWVWAVAGSDPVLWLPFRRALQRYVVGARV